MLTLAPQYSRCGVGAVPDRQRNQQLIGAMTSRFDGYNPPCIPTRAYKVPAGPDWIHEIKHDGYRLQVRRDANAPSSPDSPSAES
jgi:ATP-dependent DNA ligase